MDELDFSSATPRPAAPGAPPPPAAVYKPAVALEFFRAAGQLEEVPGGKTFFQENDKPGGFFSGGSRMYLLLDGDIGLMAKGRFIGIIKPGDIFGEIAMLARAPRTATAMAKTLCKVLSLDEKQFNVALQKKPEFALMMMAIMVQRLRQAVARRAEAGGGAPDAVAEREAVFGKKDLAAFAQEINPVRMEKGKVIMKAGDTGVFMYVVHSGKVAISIGDKVVERVGPGSVFGEMALVDNAARAAGAVAEAESELIMVRRADFLTLIQGKPQFGSSILRTIAERIRAAS
ncbi:MAG TPA: cyclic nucleotide-binding domain-containing protein [Burkholderiales bacterium]|nr:cyclic nucleotide-binding domain-containing protein [Burkholderiales bacterium]